MFIGRAIDLHRRLGPRRLAPVLCGPPRLCVLCVERTAQKPPSNVWTFAGVAGICDSSL